MQQGKAIRRKGMPPGVCVFVAPGDTRMREHSPTGDKGWVQRSWRPALEDMTATDYQIVDAPAPPPPMASTRKPPPQ
jgi:hypothetical protein